MLVSLPPAEQSAARCWRPVTRAALALLVAAGVLFTLEPGIDLAVSRAFVGADGRFVGADNAPLAAVMDAITHASRGLAVVLLLATVLAWLPWPRALAALRRRRRGLLYVFAVLALGPGLLVNAVLKDHSGRARPIQTTEFGGARAFSPAFEIADECRKNCSFVSGHAAFATMPIAGAFLAATRRRRRGWLAAGFTCAIAVGIGRIASGAHFASDVLVAVLLVYLVAAACARCLPCALPGGASQGGTSQGKIAP